MTHAIASARIKRNVEARETSLGAASALACASATISMLGVLVISLGYAFGREHLRGGVALFWIGHVLVYAPVLLFILRPDSSRRAIEVLIVLLALETYMIKWLYTPTQFKFIDEFMHQRGMLNVVDAGRIAVPNTSIPISQYFPGLQSASGSLATLLNNTSYLPGYILAGAAHVALLVLVYALFRDIFNSPRSGAIAALVYATNASFEVFNSYFVYETLALPLFVATLLMAWKMRGKRLSESTSWMLLALICFIATLVTHHVTAVFAMAFLLLVAVENVTRRRTSNGFSHLAVTTFSVLAVLIGIAYILSIGSIFSAYFEPYTVGALNPGKAPTFQPTATATQFAVPLFDRAATYLGFAILVISTTLVALRQRKSTVVWKLPFGLTALAFVLSLPAGKLLPFGSQIYGRSSAYTYLGVAFIAGVAFSEPVQRQTRRIMYTIGFTVVLLGGLAVAVPPFWSRLPGKYYPKGFESGVDERVLYAANWVGANIREPGSFMADANGNAVLSTLAYKDVTHNGDQLFYLPSLAPDGTKIIRDYQIRFAWVDERLATVASPSARYFYGASNGYFTGPPTVAELNKFSSDEQLSCIYDDGEIRIYDMSRLLG